MPTVPTHSPATNQPAPPSYVHTLQANFVDSTGRTLLLRGVNLSGASKAPPNHLSHILDDFWETAQAGGESFVGRPLNLDDGSADIHLSRLRAWGFNFFRFPITWESLEHEGPGLYDYEFMDYTIRVLQKCRDYGFRVFMDPHQDTWSRFSGGSGAPYWTLPACGINPQNITPTQAAIVHCEYPSAEAPDPASQPAMIWSTNYGRLLSQTVFTLFFGGRTWAPKCVLDGVNIQDYLQSRFIGAFGALAARIRETDPSLYEDCVIGWDSLNEPFEGLIGYEDLNKNPTAQGSGLKKGTAPTPAQSLRLGMGQAQTVENWSFGVFGPSRNGSVTIDPKGVKLWADPDDVRGELPNGYHPQYKWTRAASWPLGVCPWALHGVWDVETGYILQPDYFRFHPEMMYPAPPQTGNSEPRPLIPNPKGSLEASFIPDCWKPHWLAWSSRLRREHPESIWFIQPPVFAIPPAIGESEKTEFDGQLEFEYSTDSEGLHGRCCYSPHYYDGLTLITRHWNWFNADALGVLRGKYSSPIQAVKVGEGAIRQSIQQQLAVFKEDALLLGAVSAESPSSSASGSTTQLPAPPSESTSSLHPPGAFIPNPSTAPQTTVSIHIKQPAKISYPITIGEIGIPYDMDGKRAYGWTDNGKYLGDYSRQTRALDASLNACEGPNGLSMTVWNFIGDGASLLGVRDDGEPEVTDHTHEWGDGWNLEDLSLWSGRDVWVVRDMEKHGPKDPKGKHRAARKAKVAKKMAESQQSVLMGDHEGTMLDVNASRSSLVNRKDRGGKKGVVVEQMKPSLAMVAAASSLSVASLGSAGTSTLASAPNTAPPSPAFQAKVPAFVNDAASSSDELISREIGVPSRALRRVLACHANPYDFLVDGGRAYKAFCRPYPVRSVGIPKHVELDIGKAVWKCTITVRAEDRPKAPSGYPSAGQDDDQLVTEIYVPIVHFAHPRLLQDDGSHDHGIWRSRTRTAVVNKKTVESGGSSVTLDLDNLNQEHAPAEDDAPRHEHIPVVGASPILSSIRQHEPIDLFAGINSSSHSEAPSETPSIPTISLSEATPRPSTAVDDDTRMPPVELKFSARASPAKSTTVPSWALPIGTQRIVPFLSTKEVGFSSSEEGSGDEDGGWDWESNGPLIDIEVTVSEGSWRVEGQCLFWKYDCPEDTPELGSLDSTQALSSPSTTSLTGNARKEKKQRGEAGVKEVTIEIRRRGGPIKQKEEEFRRDLALRRDRGLLSASASAGSNLSGVSGTTLGGGAGGSSSTVGSAAQWGKGPDRGARGRQGNWCEDMCPREGCTVM